MAVATLSSCGNSTPKADLQNEIDTVSYAIGMTNSQGLKDYLATTMGVDTTYMDEFIKGLNEGINIGDDKKMVAYYSGIQIGQQVSNQMVSTIEQQLFGQDSTQHLSMKNFMAGFIAGTTGKNGIMGMEQAQILGQTKTEAIKSKTIEKEYGPNKEAGEKWLAENAKKEGVVTLPDGLQYKVITMGEGEKPLKEQKVSVKYEGKMINGTVFDSSYKRNPQTTEFRCDQVIKGWTEALQLMPVGSKWELYIPQELAYGERQAGQIKPFSTLIFTVELVDIVKENPKDPKSAITASPDMKNLPKTAGKRFVRKK